MIPMCTIYFQDADCLADMAVADNTLKDNRSDQEILCWSYFCSFIGHLFHTSSV